MSRLAVLWAVHGVAGSFAQAGAAIGALAVADAALGPQVARLVDRWGQRRVVAVTGSLFVVGSGTLVWACLQGWTWWLLVVLAGVVGATAPPVGALSAARWRQLLGSTDRLRSALALEGALNDLTFLIGPVLVTALSATLAGWVGLVISGGLVAVGLVGLLSATGTEPAPTGSAPGALVDRRLLDRRFLTLASVHLSMGSFFGGVPVVITAFCLAHGVGALAGVASAVAGVVSLLAGLVYGGLERTRPLTVMTMAGGLLAGGTALLALVPDLPSLMVGYGIVGGCVALVLIPAAVLLPQVTEGGVYVQAMSWTNSASAIGIAAAAPLVGAVVEGHDWRLGFLVTAALTALLPISLLLGRRRLGVAGRA